MRQTIPVCCECGGEAQGGELLWRRTATGDEWLHRCWACFLGPALAATHNDSGEYARDC